MKTTSRHNNLAENFFLQDILARYGSLLEYLTCRNVTRIRDKFRVRRGQFTVDYHDLPHPTRAPALERLSLALRVAPLSSILQVEASRFVGVPHPQSQA